MDAQILNNQTLDNDSTKKQLGFEYQKLIALEQCLNAKKGEYVYIECFGDVQKGNESIEVKHHLSESNLTSNSTDVWKTLMNLLTGYDTLKANDKFILHTTQHIQSDSIFYEWNTLTKAVKYRKLRDHSVSTTSQKYKDVIIDGKKDTKDRILEILDKFLIYHSQPKIEEKLKQLAEHAAFLTVREEFINNAIWVLHGYLTEKAIENSNKWEISITDFRKDLQHSVGPYTKDYTLFPIVPKRTIDDDSLTDGYKFIYKLGAISLKRADLHQALHDYVRSEEAYTELLTINPLLQDHIVEYESNIETDLRTEKSAVSYSLSPESFRSNSHISYSIQVYFSCLRKNHSEIRGVKGTEKFFRDGRIHSIAETTDFEWQFKETDLE